MSNDEALRDLLHDFVLSVDTMRRPGGNVARASIIPVIHRPLAVAP
jgi:hypothetical protein